MWQTNVNSEEVTHAGLDDHTQVQRAPSACVCKYLYTWVLAHALASMCSTDPKQLNARLCLIHEGAASACERSMQHLWVAYEYSRVAYKCVSVSTHARAMIDYSCMYAYSTFACNVHVRWSCLWSVLYRRHGPIFALSRWFVCLLYFLMSTGKFTEKRDAVKD